MTVLYLYTYIVYCIRKYIDFVNFLLFDGTEIKTLRLERNERAVTRTETNLLLDDDTFAKSWSVALNERDNIRRSLTITTTTTSNNNNNIDDVKELNSFNLVVPLLEV